MPPHGRRRLATLPFGLLLLSLLLSTVSAVSSSVIGIDLGTEYIKASLVKPGVPLDIILTKDSKRKETAAVAFKGSKTKSSSGDTDGGFPERIYGSDAIALFPRFPKDVFPNLKALLGSSMGSAVATEYNARFPELALVQSPETGSLAFKSNSFLDSAAPFSIEELLAMELKNIKANAETMAGKGHTVEDAVITVPAFFTAQEKQAVSTAVELAGLRPISLLSDGLAVGLNYATSRTFPVVNEGGQPEYHLVYDVGAGSATATVLRFQGRTVKDVGKYNKTIQEVQVVGTGHDRTLGGDELNRVILDDMITKFAELPSAQKTDASAAKLRQDGRSMAKLWREAERLRHILSANSEAQMNLESFFSEDVNFKYKLTRANFEKLATELFERVQAPLSQALEMAKLSMDDLQSVILHGGVIRTPAIQKQLESLVKSDKLKSNVNSDEAAALGSGFRAATISPSFRVKEIRIAEIAGYPVYASWNNEGKDKKQKLFVPTSVVGHEKQVTFGKWQGELEIDLSQHDPLTEQSVPISKVKTLNLTQSIKSLSSKAGCASEDIVPKLAIRLSPLNGLPEVTSASITCDAVEQEKKGWVVDGVKDFLGFGKKEDQKPMNVEDSSSSASSSDSSTTSPSTSTSTSENATPSDKPSEKAKDAKAKAHTIALDLSTEPLSTSGLKAESLARIQERLADFDHSDRSRTLRSETLNNLESYAYSVPGIVENSDFEAVSTSQQREEILNEAKEVSNWLYEGGSDETRAILKERLDKLRNLVKPVQSRLKEYKKRPDAIKALHDAINQAETMEGIIKQYMTVPSSSSETSTSSSTSEPSTTESASSSSDEFADLDEESTSTTSTTTSSPSSSATSEPMFTEADLTLVEERRLSVQKWFNETSAEQDKLALSDEPVLLVKELRAKAKDIEEMATALLMRQIKQTPKIPKKTKSKSAKAKKSSSTESSTSTGVDSESTSQTEAASTSKESAASSTIAVEDEASPAAPPPEPAASADDPDAAAAANFKAESAPPVPEDGPSLEEQMRMFKEQEKIDAELAASYAAAKSEADARASASESKKAKPTGKAKSKSKAKAKTKTKSKSKKSTSKSKEKPKHSEL